MRNIGAIGLAVSIVIGASCSGDGVTGNGGIAAPGPWGSGAASLSVTASGATIRIRAGECYGSYGVVGAPVPAGSFSLSGTFTQLMGAYPGKIDYAAQFTGATQGQTMTLTITVPALERTVGPFSLVHGVTTTWPQCLYP
jgi:hypothetical protein